MPAVAAPTLTTMDDYAEEAMAEESPEDEGPPEGQDVPATLAELTGDEPELPSVAGVEDDVAQIVDGAGDDDEESAERGENEPATAILPPLDLSADSRSEQAEPDSSDEAKPGDVNE